MSKTRVRQSDPDRERYWRGVVQGQERSGQSVREYCRSAGVKESAFYWWRRELVRRSQARKIAGPRRPGGRKPARSSAGRGQSGELKSGRRPRREKPGTETALAGGPPGGNASLFVPIEVLAGGAPAGVEIHLGDGRMICVRPGFDPQTLCEVLAALEGRTC
jgi:hypothetical protein